MTVKLNLAGAEEGEPSPAGVRVVVKRAETPTPEAEAEEGSGWNSMVANAAGAQRPPQTQAWIARVRPAPPGSQFDLDRHWMHPIPAHGKYNPDPGSQTYELPPGYYEAQTSQMPSLRYTVIRIYLIVEPDGRVVRFADRQKKKFLARLQQDGAGVREAQALLTDEEKVALDIIVGLAPERRIQLMDLVRRIDLAEGGREPLGQKTKVIPPAEPAKFD